MRIRTVRFTKEEEKFIGEFLDKNPFFDFSSLARAAILSFVKEPTLKIQGIGVKTKTQKGHTTNV